MDVIKESLNVVNMEFSDQEEKIHSCRFSRKARVCGTGLSVLIIAILPNFVTSNDYNCGVNRFNNESPLTERIVGGNNSLQ